MTQEEAPDDVVYTHNYGGIIRGRKDEKKIALIFTGGEYGQGAEHILDVLKERGIAGAFFFTGDYLAIEAHHQGIARMIDEGHYIGPHSHAHLLYAPWEDRTRTLVTREQFREDLQQNIDGIAELGFPRERIHWFIPPYEWYNDEISEWTREMGLQLINFTPGTLSHADYTTADAKNYRSSEVIYESIMKFEEQWEDGLNGFLLLTHVGANEKRPDMFYLRLAELIDELKGRRYEFVSVGEMLSEARKENLQEKTKE